jgi:two-component system, cell cycle sensor histidine kinase and response regulator CckA
MAMKLFRKSSVQIGLVEQSQVVASTAVIVAMGTIVTVHYVTQSPFTWLDFISITTVGVIGFVSVFFSLKYGRMLEEQRRELLELNTIGEAVNHSVELDYVLQSALAKVMELMHAPCGWIYLLENEGFILKHSFGTVTEFFASADVGRDGLLRWITEPSVLRSDDPRVAAAASDEFRKQKFQILASIPLVRQGAFAGVLVIAGTDERKFEVKKIGLIQAFGNQISVALQNASLFDQLRKSERLYADLFEYSPDMYHSVNRFGIVISCNLTESQVLGYQKEEIIGQPVLKLYPPEQHLRVRSHLSRVFEHAQDLKGVEEQMQKKDGGLLDVSVNSSLVYDREGKPSVVRIVLRDITLKKKMDEKIFQAQKIDSIGSLTAGIAHNFNNILTAILGSASIMRRKVSSDPRLLKYIDLIEDTSRRGAAMTHQLNMFARKDTPRSSPVAMNNLINETLVLFAATTPKMVHIKFNPSAQTAIVDGDDGQLQQALLNLCLNARDAMPNGGVLVIDCSVVSLDEEQAGEFADGKEGEYVMVRLTDSGSGIPREILHRIFEPLFTTKEPGKGTGLGLSVVYGIIRSHHGYVGVQSEVDSGSTFTIYLPRSSSSPVEKRAEKEDIDVHGGTERILLIEDEISVGQVGSDLLGDLGYVIELAENGRDAIDRLDSGERYDLAILDMNMPRMGGRETFKQIKLICPSLKVLVCSGYSASVLDDKEFAQAIDGFIQKPYEAVNLARKIRTILDSPPIPVPSTAK